MGGKAVKNSHKRKTTAAEKKTAEEKTLQLTN
jgi:hypothetical protein